MPTLKLHSNTVIGTLAVDGWAVTFGTARMGHFFTCDRYVEEIKFSCRVVSEWHSLLGVMTQAAERQSAGCIKLA